jgi:hypothetical protein
LVTFLVRRPLVLRPPETQWTMVFSSSTSSRTMKARRERWRALRETESFFLCLQCCPHRLV